MKTCRISQGAGDVIASVPYMKLLGIDKVYVVHGHPNVPGWHPVNNGGAEAVLPLLRSQGFEAQAIKFQDCSIYNFDMSMDARVELGWNGAMGDIYTWNSLFYGVYPDMTKPFLDIDEASKKDVIVLSQTARYLSIGIDYRELNNYDIDKIFIGTPGEYEYCMQLYQGLKNVEDVATPNFYEAAKIIKSSRLFISNQNALAVVAEGVAVNRILAICKDFPSVVPKTPNGRAVISQRFFNLSVAELLGV